ncbi:hypothetical protein PR202_ga02705 [Eleusine coracana subsp. coracana]|uniref:At1g61320/AtMIF1 LRR domain-containing protein n=1 Tax=Eleusine coracana subsp. coracana TaxID=191504 RepID=A0AAV5BKS7_ELECO|nr:hypothetical protein PR202_ga02705 [Eleusine coracana subsp. coracana]
MSTEGGYFGGNIVYLRIPCLQQLNSLEVLGCGLVQVIESKAPNLSNLRFVGDLHVCLLLGRTPPLKKLSVTYDEAAFYARTEFPSSMPNLEALSICSRVEVMPVCQGVSIFVDPLDLRTVPEHHHDKLRHVEIINFSSAKSLIELTCHILQSIRLLERLTLDTTEASAMLSFR